MPGEGNDPGGQVDDPKKINPASGEADPGKKPGDADPSDPEGEGSTPDESSWDEGTKKYIQKLRKESATYRTKSKELEGKVGSLSSKVEQFTKGLKKLSGGEDPGADDLPPEEQIKGLTNATETLQLRLALSESARQNGISTQEDFEYFEFLMGKELAGLDEDAELSDERMAEIVTQVKTKSAASAGSGDTSITGKKPNPKGGDQTTLDGFVKMNISERSALYQKSPELYNQLFAEAKTKKLL